MSLFSSPSCSQAMSKRTQEENGEERIAAKSKPMISLVSRTRARFSPVPISTASASLVSFRFESRGLGLVATSTGKPVALNSNQMQDSLACTVQPVAWDSVIDVDLETSREYNLSAESVSLMERVNTRLRMMMNRLPGDRMDDLDKHSLKRCMLKSSSINAAVCLGKYLPGNLHSIRNTDEKPTVKKLFEVSQRLIRPDTIQSARALGSARQAHTQGHLSSPWAPNVACDEWYVGDGQLRLMLGFARWTVPWLRLAPCVAALLVATSKVLRDFCARTCARVFWVGLTIRKNDTRAPLHQAPPVGHVSTSTARPGSCCGLRDAVLEDHAPTVVVFTRCPDFSKLVHHMRIDGGVLDHDLLASFDGLRSAAGASLCEHLLDHSWWEATGHGGLGFRAALSVALLSFVLDRITSKPFVRTMVEHFLRGHLGFVSHHRVCT